jgi:hypothetical protein
MSGPDGSSTGLRTIALIFVAAAFCAVSYSRNHYWDEYFYLHSVWQHSVGDLVAMEGVLSDGLFPNGFFSGKLGFVALLDALVSVTGPGEGALAVLRGVFCALTLALGLASWLLLREMVDAPAAWKTAVVALFLPIPLYLGFKLLSEGPSLLLATLGGWQLLQAVRRDGHGRFVHLLIAAMLLAGAICMRVTSVLFLAGLIAALIVWRPPHISKSRLWRDTAIVLVLLALIVAAVTLPLIGWPAERFTGLASSVTGRSQGPLVMIYALVLTVQFFAAGGILALAQPVQSSTRGALIWLAVGVLPYVLAASYIEPRYFYTATIPLALLAATGLDRLAARLTRRRQDLAWIALLAITVALNRILWAPVMLYEINEKEYSTLVHELRSRAPSASYVTPWLSDFCYLSFAFPSERVGLALSESYGSGRVFSQPQFRQWLGSRVYVGDIAQLAALPRPWFYVGWDYSPTVRAIDQRLGLFGLDYLDDPSRQGQLLNHLTPSWIWSSDALRLTPAASVGPYQAFEIVPREVP